MIRVFPYCSCCRTPDGASLWRSALCHSSLGSDVGRTIGMKCDVHMYKQATVYYVHFCNGPVCSCTSGTCMVMQTMQARDRNRDQADCTVPSLDIALVVCMMSSGSRGECSVCLQAEPCSGVPSLQHIAPSMDTLHDTHCNTAGAYSVVVHVDALTLLNAATIYQ
jgi:hypothetical protein